MPTNALGFVVLHDDVFDPHAQPVSVRCFETAVTDVVRPDGRVGLMDVENSSLQTSVPDGMFGEKACDVTVLDAPAAVTSRASGSMPQTELICCDDEVGVFPSTV
jgi:hypothetical protein